MKKVRLLFQGDSITDACRNREEFYDLGEGYPKYAAKYLTEKYPQFDFEFINKGISGDQTINLLQRLDSDFIAIQPDIVSILIGINDTWSHSFIPDWLPDSEFEEQYKKVLEAIKTKTNAKIMIIEQFLGPVEDKAHFRVDMASKIEITRKLAREYADVFMPLDGLLCSAFVGEDPLSFAPDGIHPSPKGADYIGKLYVDYVSEILDKNF